MVGCVQVYFYDLRPSGRAPGSLIIRTTTLTPSVPVMTEGGSRTHAQISEGLWSRILMDSDRFSAQRDIPAGVCGQAKKQNQPPGSQNHAHPEFVAQDAQSLRQEICADGQQNVQAAEFGDAPQRRMRGGERVVSLAKFERYLWTHMSAK